MANTVQLFKEHGDTSIHIEAAITDAGDLQISGQDIGKVPEEIWGDTDYEYWVTVKSEHKDRVLLALIEQLFAGNSSAVSEFQQFLESKGIPCDFSSWT